MIQVSKFWADFCRHLGREDMIDDERWNTPEKLHRQRRRRRPRSCTR